MRKQQQKFMLDRDYKKKFFVKVGVHQGSVFSPLLFAIVVDVVTEDAREGLMNEIYINDLVMKSETMEDLQKKFLKWKMAFERKGTKFNIRKTKVMVCGS